MNCPYSTPESLYNYCKQYVYVYIYIYIYIYIIYTYTHLETYGDQKLYKRSTKQLGNLLAAQFTSLSMLMYLYVCIYTYVSKKTLSQSEEHSACRPWLHKVNVPSVQKQWHNATTPASIITITFLRSQQTQQQLPRKTTDISPTV